MKENDVQKSKKIRRMTSMKVGLCRRCYEWATVSDSAQFRFGFVDVLVEFLRGADMILTCLGHDFRDVEDTPVVFMK